MSLEKEIMAHVEGNKVVVTIPIETLICAFDYKEDNQGYYTVGDPDKFSESVAWYLQNHVDNQETGLTVLQETIDSIFDEMVCSAEDFINYLEDMEEE